MKWKIFMTLLCGVITYIIVVLSGLLLHLPLSIILWKGILAFVFVGVGCWCILYLMEILANKENQKHSDDNKETIDSKIENISKTGVEDQPQDFSPLNPPVLEVNQDENSQQLD